MQLELNFRTLHENSAVITITFWDRFPIAIPDRYPPLGRTMRIGKGDPNQRPSGISTRGNTYLRRMLIHGAHVVLFRVKYDTAGFGPCMLAQQSRGRDRQQTGAHCLGGVVQRERLSASTTADDRSVIYGTWNGRCA